MRTEGVRYDVDVGGGGGVGVLPRLRRVRLHTVPFFGSNNTLADLRGVVRLAAHGVEHHRAVRLNQVEHDVAHAKVSHFVAARRPAEDAHDLFQHVAQQTRGGRYSP